MSSLLIDPLIEVLDLKRMHSHSHSFLMHEAQNIFRRKNTHSNQAFLHKVSLSPSTTAKFISHAHIGIVIIKANYSERIDLHFPLGLFYCLTHTHILFTHPL